MGLVTWQQRKVVIVKVGTTVPRNSSEVAKVMQSFPCKHHATIRLVTTLVRKENIKQTLHFHDLTSLSRITMMNYESYFTVMNQESRM